MATNLEWELERDDGILFDSRPDDPDPRSGYATDNYHTSVDGQKFDGSDASHFGLEIIGLSQVDYTPREYDDGMDRDARFLATVRNWK
ncbi:MAG: hypothetical protein AB1668_01555 [Nanoarchaeota archaeon]